MPGKITSRAVALAAALLAGAGFGCGTMVSDVEPEEPVAPAKGTPAPAAIETAPPKPVEPPPPPPPRLTAEKEKHILGILSDMRQNQRRGMMNVPENDGKLLRKLVLEAGAKHVVEIGTSNGYSGIWMCLALKATGGKLTTYEIDARRAGLARENFKRAGSSKVPSTSSSSTPTSPATWTTSTSSCRSCASAGRSSRTTRPRTRGG
jgi:hypothetical protein